MIWKRLDEIHAELKTVLEEQARTAAKIDAEAATLIGIRRDLRAPQNEAATLGAAVDGHTHRFTAIDNRLEQIEKKLSLTRV